MEDDNLLELMTCVCCIEIYHNPVILPCLKTICAKHLLQANAFECSFWLAFKIV